MCVPKTIGDPSPTDKANQSSNVGGRSADLTDGQGVTYRTTYVATNQPSGLANASQCASCIAVVDDRSGAIDSDQSAYIPSSSHIARGKTFRDQTTIILASVITILADQAACPRISDHVGCSKATVDLTPINSTDQPTNIVISSDAATEHAHIADH